MYTFNNRKETDVEEEIKLNSSRLESDKWVGGSGEEIPIACRGLLYSVTQVVWHKVLLT